MPAPDPAIAFRPLAADDLDLVARWRDLDSQVVRARYAERLTGKGKKRAFVALDRGQPAALVQVYRLADFPGYETMLDFPEEARGLDAFFAPDIDAGLAATIVTACLAQIVYTDAAVPCCYAAPPVTSSGAIAIYRRAGFRDVGIVATPDGDEQVVVHVPQPARPG